MPLFPNNFKHNPNFRTNKDYRIEGLQTFKNDLERYFFSLASVCNCDSDTTESSLSIELDCNLSLLELLFYFNKGDWGNAGDLKKALARLSEVNDLPIALNELSLHLKDTSIIINKIYDESIPQQLDEILGEIARHYIYFTKGLAEIPYEIFVPVFEEDNWETNRGFLNMVHDNNTKKDYFGYWGVYYNSQEEASIYDLENLSLISGDLYMLNSAY